MYDIRISDNLYELAREAAQAQHVSIDAFVEEAVQLRLQDEVLRLTPEQAEKVRAGLEDIRAGRVFTPEEAKANFEEHRKQWLAGHPV
jgi:predicted transcriptional regulator